MGLCCAINCNSRTERKSGKSFHRLPLHSKELLSQWLKNIRRDNWKPTRSSIICSDHFIESQFDRTGQTVRLRSDAVPTIFSFPEHLQKVTKLRKPPAKRTVPPLHDGGLSVDLHTDNCEAKLTPHFSVFSAELDHSYALNTETLKRRLHNGMQRHSKSIKKIKIARQQVLRLKRKVLSLKSIIADLRRNGMLNEGSEQMLLASISDVPRQIIHRLENNQRRGMKTTQVYPSCLKAFAMTLQFYSSKAYNYVRKTFGLSLPHPSVIRKWYMCINGDPGFCSEAFRTLECKAKLATDENQKVLCSLMLDEMSIKKHIEWDGKQFQGYVDIGAGIQDDESKVATESLVFMVVSLQANWKVPIAYFLIAGLSGEERANLVKEALVRLHNINIIITSVTFDGPSCHFNMARNLGADLRCENPTPYFQHPSVIGEPVFCILDTCHMLKLVRNTFASQKILLDENSNQINWCYIELLHEIQEAEGLRAGNKLRKAHIDWSKQKMKVNLAAQTLSSSVADAIEFCTKDLKLPLFQGSDATVRFIRTFDRLFDILNSRNPVARGYKAPMKLENESQWRPFLHEAAVYIQNLKTGNGKLLVQSKQKTGYVGLIVTSMAITQMFDKFVSSTKLLKYFLTYKFSQDHLELFFSAIRARGGWNNNPTVSQFKTAFKRLLLRHEIATGGTGNVLELDRTTMLNLSRDVIKVKDSDLDVFDVSTAKKYNLDIQLEYEDHDYCQSVCTETLSEFGENVVYHIAGYVVRMVQRRVSCLRCLEELEVCDATTNKLAALISRKNRGGLILPSIGVVQICMQTERALRHALAVNNHNLPNVKGFQEVILCQVLEYTCSKGEPVFASLFDHMFDTLAENNHLYTLVKCVSKCFLTIRMHHLAKSKTERVVGEVVRKKLSRLIIFKNQ